MDNEDRIMTFAGNGDLVPEDRPGSVIELGMPPKDYEPSNETTESWRRNFEYDLMKTKYEAVYKENDNLYTVLRIWQGIAGFLFIVVASYLFLNFMHFLVSP